MKLSGIILGFLLLTTIPVAGNNSAIRTQGLVTASACLVAGGTYLLCRRSYGKIDKLFEVVGGLALIAAGVAGIVLSGEISDKIEELYYK